jgi:hypothetical protein
MATHEEIEEFFTCWSPIVRAAAGVEVCAMIDAVFNAPHEEVTPWTDFTWADVQAEIEATSREAINFANRIIGEPEIDPWEHINVQERVEAVIEQTRMLIETGCIINLSNE